METNKCSTRACNNEKQNIFITMLQRFAKRHVNKKEVLVEKHALKRYSTGLHIDKDVIYFADEETINFAMNKIYEYNGQIVVSKNDIEKIEKCYKKDFDKHLDYESFLDANPELEVIFKDFKAGKCEIEKQLKLEKALQPGILCECAYTQTLAKIFKANNFIDLESIPYCRVPKGLIKYIEPSAETVCSGRYIYYNSDFSIVIVQYGNPDTYDVALFINNKFISMELKDENALLADCDLLYNENGKFIVSDEVINRASGFEFFINRFNNTETVMTFLGHNYKLVQNYSDKERIKKILSLDLNTSNFSLLVTSTKSNELIAVKLSDMFFEFSDGTTLFDTSGSEIRMTGKNARKSPFTPNFLEKILAEKDVEIDEKKGVCRVYKNNEKVLGFTRGRGQSNEKATRFKINEAFFVRIKDVVDHDDYIEFSKNKINQNKSGISIHIEIKKTKKEIMEELCPARVLAGFCFAA